VTEGNQSSLFKVDNYPNPLVNSTIFRIFNNKSDDELKYFIDIYNSNGSKVKSLSGNSQSGGYVDLSLPWDGTSDSGMILPSGVYFYKVYYLDESNVRSNILSSKLIINR
jgi:flagellar hook assembly protein FlgD